MGRATGDSLLRPEVADYTETGYEQCWYPIARSNELPDKQLVGRDVLDGRVILYRDSTGVAHALSAYCPHMGADLAQGQIQGDDVRCAFHHWRYGSDGVCRHIPSLPEDGAIPHRARVFAYPTEEKFSLIWLFNGMEPSYPLPTFEDRVDMSRTIYKVFESEEDFRADPWWIFTTNAFDFQHLRHLHGLDEVLKSSGIETMPLEVTEHSIGYGGGAITVWGVNVIVGVAPHRTMFGGGTPCLGGTRRGYRVYAADVGDASALEIERAETHIEELYEQETRIIVDEDVPIVSTLDYTKGGVMVPADRELLTFLRYAERYPRIRQADLIECVRAGRSSEDTLL